MQLVSLNVSKPQDMDYKGKTVATGIFKQRVGGPVVLSFVNLEGDGQGDLKYHGGPDKAVCIYCAEHYPFWEERLARELGYGAFGENFTVTGLLETDVHIGDVFEIGTALVQVTQPRQPCYKLAHKHGVPELASDVERTGYTGYYFRVLREGTVEAGQSLLARDRDPAGISVAEANQLNYRARTDTEGMRRLLAVDALSGSWRSTFEKRLVELEA
ncbi:MOSC domain-containing protein [Paenibacillus filicis]|uniref:MOSC domain-containing protein n=1 Tax=Paenibacillus gyeongsangnamensis TaxID=3388067 RepID=A0ABT4QLP2_9BACL|nr:MOSC domain-containing protein [Paenibacillus filicis]MCZ8517760.1 MOSC domain-containing protein [Paenibacillus filicis]